ncbi:hypothetical protein HanIR_Chr03g0126181 [Helianthus annuus]|nr:hypothetical protein HanIR_Chr03g0126181 [Helianthus annuus]
MENLNKAVMKVKPEQARRNTMIGLCCISHNISNHRFCVGTHLIVKPYFELIL